LTGTPSQTLGLRKNMFSLCRDEIKKCPNSS
jgi:hypothetical protein